MTKASVSIIFHSLPQTRNLYGRDTYPPRWPLHHPFHWLAAAENGDAKAMPNSASFTSVTAKRISSFSSRKAAGGSFQRSPRLDAIGLCRSAKERGQPMLGSAMKRHPNRRFCHNFGFCTVYPHLSSIFDTYRGPGGLSESPQNSTHECSKIFQTFPCCPIDDPKVHLPVFMHNQIPKTHRLDHLLR